MSRGSSSVSTTWWRRRKSNPPEVPEGTAPELDADGHGPDGDGRNPDNSAELPPVRGAQAGQFGTEAVAADPKAGTHQEHNAQAGGWPLDPELLELVQGWRYVPAAVRAAILAIVRSIPRPGSD